MSAVSQMFDSAYRHHRAGKLHEAEQLYRQILQIDPRHADALNLLGLMALQADKNEQAVAYLSQALRLSPDHADALNNFGNALMRLGKLEEAVVSLRRAVRLKPDFTLAHQTLGNVLKEQGKLQEALASYGEALRCDPNFAEAHDRAGVALALQGKAQEAIASFRQAVRCRPDFADGHYNLGIVLGEQQQFDEAVECYRQALRLKPAFADAYNNLGNDLKELGRLDEAITLYRAGLEAQPRGNLLHSNLVFLLHYHPGYDSAAILEQNREWNRRHAEPLKSSHAPHVNPPDPQRRLRIGYVSPDFHNHCQSLFTVPLLSRHDHRQFEIFCYADDWSPDLLTERLRRFADVWRNTYRLSDEQVADMVRRDQIDILVDLTMHTAKNRLLVFARKPAPVQVTWLAYPGTTGMSAIDYRLSDPYLDPPGQHDGSYSEKTIRLPETFWCYDPLGQEPAPNQLPALSNGYVTFGCLNTFCKVNDGTLRLWAKVLQAVPASRLLLLAPRGQAREHVLATLQQEGIAAARVDFTDRQPRPDYLKLYHQIDLGLDLLPYNGHTTSLDAFWMGVPTITLIGGTVVGRAGWSQLCNLGLRELAAHTPDQYVALVAKLAGDLPRLVELRATLRQRMRHSPLMDGNRFVKHMEDAFRQMWRGWCEAIKYSDEEVLVSRVPQLFEQAVQHHQRGNLAEAEQFYRQILQIDAQHFDALHLLGLIAHQAGKNDIAIDFLQQALRLRPTDAETRNHLGNAFKGRGLVREAIESYQEALRHKPELAEAHNNLGVAFMEQDKLAEAIASFQQALRLRPNYPFAQNNLAIVFRQVGRLDEAAASLKQAIHDKPDFAEAHKSLGDVFTLQKRPAEAVASYQHALRIQPDNPEALNDLGTVLASLGRLEEAVSCYQQALRLRPNAAEAHNNLGIALKAQGRFAEAEASLRRALSLRPGYAHAHSNLGNTLTDQGKFDEAVAAYRQAVGLKPDYFEAYNNLGNALAALGKSEEALATYQAAVRLNPNVPEVYNNLGKTFWDQGRLEESIAQCRHALSLKPDFAEAYNNLGNALKDQGKLAEAVVNFQEAVRLKPDYAKGYFNLGNTRMDQGELNEGVASYQQAIRLAPSLLAARGQMVHGLQHLCLWNHLEEQARWIEAAVLNPAQGVATDSVAPFIFLSLPTLTTPQQQLDCARLWVSQQLSNVGRLDYSGNWPARARDRSRLRIGYLSADFRTHAIAHLAAELFEKHDRTRVELYGYSYAADDGSAMRRRLVQAFDKFIDIKNASVHESAQCIHQDGVDILVDLTGYTREARTKILALRPAPIQVNYLGYPGTMGAAFMDYIFVDEFIVPGDQQPFFAEQLVHLPGCYQVNDSQRAIATDTPDREACGLPKEGFVFCCFNNNYKITPAIFSVWMRLLQRVPGSVLWLLEGNRWAPANLRREAEGRGVAADRLVFAPRRAGPEHLARHRLADLFLDTYPYNAHVTSSDALWAGCPVLTVVGQTFASRVAGSQLLTLGLSELITNNLQDYESLAFDLTQDRGRLADLRSRLAANRAGCSLFDATRFARNLEDAFDKMWARHAAGEKPRGFKVNGT